MPGNVQGRPYVRSFACAIDELAFQLRAFQDTEISAGLAKAIKVLEELLDAAAANGLPLRRYRKKLTPAPMVEIGEPVPYVTASARICKLVSDRVSAGSLTSRDVDRLVPRLLRIADALYKSDAKHVEYMKLPHESAREKIST